MSVVGAIMVPHPPLLLPEVGRGGEKEIAETSRCYEEAAAFVRDCRPETIVLTSPHAILYSDYFHISPGRHAEGNMGRFGAPQVRFSVDYDEAFVKALSELAEKESFPAGTYGDRMRELDHGTMVPLYFLNQQYKDYRLVRIGLSGESLLDHYRLGRMIRRIAEKLDRRVVHIASGDLSQKLQKDGPYGFIKEGPVYDERIMDVMGRAAFEELLDFPESLLDKAAECGHRSFVIMAGALDGFAVETRKLHHESKTGVGYGICTYRVTGEDAGRCFYEKRTAAKRVALEEARRMEDAYVALARKSLTAYITRKEVIDVPGDVPEEMKNNRAGAFVSLHKDGKLRGCIGTILPIQDNLAEEIIGNAISASTRDNRFFPVRPDEIPYLEISVDVLSEPEPIASEAELDTKRYGVIVTKGRKRGLLLPNLEGIDRIEDQVRIAKQKAGIDPEDTDVSLERFEVVRHE